MSAGQVVEFEPPAKLLRNPQSHFFQMAKEARIHTSPSTQFLADMDLAEGSEDGGSQSGAGSSKGRK